MGKQINFYMSENTQTGFVEYLQQNEFIFLDYNAKIVEEPFSTNAYRLYLYKQNYGQLFMREDLNHIMDILKSPVIEFRKTTIKLEEKKVLRGRVWIENQYFKEAICIKKPDAFIRDYRMLNRWIKKHVSHRLPFESGN